MVLHHHWVHRRRQDGKCKQCARSFQQKFPFGSHKVRSLLRRRSSSIYHIAVASAQLFDVLVHVSDVDKYSYLSALVRYIRSLLSRDRVSNCNKPTRVKRMLRVSVREFCQLNSLHIVWYNLSSPSSIEPITLIGLESRNCCTLFPPECSSLSLKLPELLIWATSKPVPCARHQHCQHFLFCAEKVPHAL